MSESLPIVYLSRHGETAWSLTGQHTGLTDLPLTERGERNARRLEERLSGLRFEKVFTSAFKRASRTCELAGFGGAAVVDPDVVEWDYGAYEGRTTAEILKERPDWELFRDGCPGGETRQHAKKLTGLPMGCRMGTNANAFLGGFRLWEDDKKGARS